MAEGTAGTIKILFVDDEEKSRKYFALIFGEEFEILVAADGAEALAMTSSGEHGEIGVVVTDQIMPRLTGLDFLEGLMAQNPDITRVLSTAFTDSELVSNAVKSRLVDYFIGKPWDIEKLQTILRQAMDLYLQNKAESRAAGSGAA